ncbi:ABC transporter permease [Clostridium tyrobutyricum]|uniref:ABC transporter permease n=1 Tax=Clostridium tyrobutyricum TaxID=1519 RepID=UPI001C38C55D|nr:ABC transporter permease [Clostridium tyrobutyricum]
MYNLLKFELYKLKNSKTFRNLFIITTILIVFILRLFYTNAGPWKLFDFIYNNRECGFFINNFKDRIHPTSLEFFNSAFGFSIVMIILIMFIVGAFVVDEYSNGTIKNIIAYGHNRIKIYISKFLIICLGIFTLVIFLLFIPVIIALILGWEKAVSISEIIRIIKSTVLICWIFTTIVSIYMCFMTIIKSKSIVIGLGIVFLFLNGAGFFSSFKFERYTPAFMLMNIGTLSPNSVDIQNMIVTCFILIILSNLLGIFIFKNQDIK